MHFLAPRLCLGASYNHGSPAPGCVPRQSLGTRSRFRLFVVKGMIRDYLTNLSRRQFLVSFASTLLLPLLRVQSAPAAVPNKLLPLIREAAGGASPKTVAAIGRKRQLSSTEGPSRESHDGDKSCDEYPHLLGEKPATGHCALLSWSSLGQGRGQHAYSPGWHAAGCCTSCDERWIFMVRNSRGCGHNSCLH